MPPGEPPMIKGGKCMIFHEVHNSSLRAGENVFHSRGVYTNFFMTRAKLSHFILFIEFCWSYFIESWNYFVEGLYND